MSQLSLTHRLRQGARALLVLAAALLALPGAQAQAVHPPDPQDGKSYRAIVFHDIRQNIKQSFAKDPEDAAVDQSVLIDFFAWLRHNQYHPVSVQQIVDANAGGKPLPPKAVLITFDDGYISFYEKVFPLLKSYGYPAVLAVVTSWMETPAGGQIRYGSQLRPRSGFITWKQAQEMVQSGLVELASHSHDLHYGQQANPQGNLLPAAVSRRYDPKTRSYETVPAYQQRVLADLKRSHELIAQRTGVRPRTMVWPYGAYNAATQEAAKSAGFTVMATLGDGPNNPATEGLTAMQRAYASYDMDIPVYAELLRMPRLTVDTRPSQRVMHVDLDYVYDPDPAQQERNLSRLIERVHAVGPRTVFLQAYSDPDGKGEASALYFPNRHLPMRADLFNRVSWQLRTRAGVDVFAWMPVMAFLPPKGDALAGRTVQMRHAGRTDNVVPGETRYRRLSPFDPAVRQWVREIYQDLGSSSRFAGILFHDDAFLGDDEDVSPAAMQAYRRWGLPADIDAIRNDKALSARWAKGKSQELIRFTHELADELRKWQPGLLTARNMYAMPLIKPVAHEWMAQDYEEFLSAYDYTAVMAMPYMERVDDPQAWLGQLARRALAVPQGARRALFELQARDWRTGKPVSDAELERQVQLLRSAGIRNIGYYPDDFLTNQPGLDVTRRLFSVSRTMKDRARDERAKGTLPAQAARTTSGGQS